MVVGLEVHVELATKTKLFSASPNRFGDEPNTNIDPVTLGLPGALPVLNRQAVELAMRLGLALNCTVQKSTFARKNYFYPDMPKAYQISQYDEPINIDGWLDLPDGFRVGIERGHLEEDTGKSTHVGGAGGRIHGSDYSLIDFNRAGVPLVEIVSRPDIRHPEQAKGYINELRGDPRRSRCASDAKMEEGSMRVDANVSVRKPGEDFNTRCEIKNVNSVRSLGRAIEYEARRQIALHEADEPVVQQTRHWDENDGRTHTLRSKEDADDYRYFLEPDLVVVDPGVEWIERVRDALPVLPAERRAILADAAGQAANSEAVMVVAERGQDELRDGRRQTRGRRRSCPEAREGSARACRARTGRERCDALEDGVVRRDHRESGENHRRGDDRVTQRRPRGHRSRTRIRGDGQLRPRGDGRPGHCWPTRSVGEVLRGRGQGDGSALVGAVMKASKGQADGKAVTALLQTKKPS